MKKISLIGGMSWESSLEYYKIINETVKEVIYQELCKGIINEASKEKYKKIINNLALKGAEGVVLGCTEIPLLIKQEDVSIPIFDTTTIHAVSAVEFALDKFCCK